MNMVNSNAYSDIDFQRFAHEVCSKYFTHNLFLQNEGLLGQKVSLNEHPVSDAAFLIAAFGGAKDCGKAFVHLLH